MQHIKNIWPTVKELADDLGVPYTTAHSWEARGRIPAAYDLDLVRYAKKRGQNLTLEELAEARRRTSETVDGHITRNANTPRQHQETPAKKVRGVA